MEISIKDILINPPRVVATAADQTPTMKRRHIQIRTHADNTMLNQARTITVGNSMTVDSFVADVCCRDGQHEQKQP